MNADVFRLDIDMSSRTNLVIASLAACSIGSLLGLYFVLKFNSPALAMFASVAIPALMAWKTNMADVVLPAKVAFFGAVGWVFGYNSIPDRVRSLQGVAESWHGENDRFIAAAVLCTIFIVAAACMTRVSQASTER